MEPLWLLLLLPMAAAGGWFMAMVDSRTAQRRGHTILPEAYFKGLNCLLNEETDQALKIFLEVVEVDDQTVEMHLALGNLFRRQGEVERATRIHHHLVARADLKPELRLLALFELAQDYFKVGLFDRAEKLFLELAETEKYAQPARRFLLQIYDQEREWRRALQIAKRLNKTIDSDLSITIAHFYCELAEVAMAAGDYPQTEQVLQSAFRYDAKCVRAVILSGRLAALLGNHTNAIAIWRGLEYLAPTALGEVVGLIANSYRALNDRHSLKLFLEAAMAVNPDPRMIALLVELTDEESGVAAGQNRLVNLVRQYPSLDSVYQLMKSRTQSPMTPPTGNRQQEQDYSLLAELLADVVESGRHYHCRQCGFQSHALHWQCPGCKTWGVAQRQLSRPLSRAD